jgi:hypothetical protein
MIPYLLPLFFYGFYQLLKTQHPARHLLIPFFLIAFLLISLLAVKKLTYSVILIPTIAIIAGIGLENLLNKIFKNPQNLWRGECFVILFWYVLCWMYYPRMEILMERNNHKHTGYPEAAQWISSRLQPNTVVIAQSPREIRYFSGLKFHESGGPVFLFPKNRNELENLIHRIEKPILLEVDLWNASKPVDFTPFSFTEEDEGYWENLGFKLKKTVHREIYLHPNHKETFPVIKIFEKAAD